MTMDMSEHKDAFNLEFGTSVPSSRSPKRYKSTALQKIDQHDIPHLKSMLTEPVFSKSCGFNIQETDLLRHTFNDPDYEPELFIKAMVNDHVAGILMAVRRPWKSGREHDAFIKAICVHPNYRYSDIGGELLHQCGKSLKEKNCKRVIFGSAAPLYLFPGVPEEDERLQTLLKQNGWELSSTRISVVADLEKSPLSQRDVNTGNERISFELVTPQTEHITMAFIEKAFTKSWALETQPAFDNDPSSFCYIATDTMTKSVIGFAAVGAANPQWFGPMGVKESLRGQGIGKQLLIHACLEAGKRGLTHMIIPWINEKDIFYRKIIQSVEERRYIKAEKELL